MPDGEEVLISSDGIKKLEQELEYLKTVKRREVAQRIKEARNFGDLNENAEYDEAKNEQAFIEGRIAKLEKTLRNARIVDESDVEPGVVNIGSTVILRNLETGEEFEYTIVGSNEADPSSSKISYKSPVGQSVFRQSVGGVVTVKLPYGRVSYEILAIKEPGRAEVTG